MRSLAIAVILLAAPAAWAEFDEDLYAALLERHTRAVADVAGTRVAYSDLASSADWRRLVDGLDGVDVTALPGPHARLAFWINAYNVLVIDLVVRNYPIDDIRDLGGLLTPVWKLEAGRVGGRPVTLHEIEHGVLRPLGDPRIHAALVCASTSCPSLRREPYSAERIPDQLEDAMQAFLADPRKGLAVDRARRRVRLSRIFDWFEEDFEAAGGPLEYVSRKAPKSERSWLAKPPEGLRRDYFDYDWTLNDLSDR